jgi:uncharacterized surface protein with fasciclin (FAS1) repeats
MKKLFAIPTFLAASLLLAACAPVSPAAPAAAPAVEATAEATEAPAVEATATEAAAEQAPAEQAAPAADIVDTAVGAGSFKTLAKALDAAGLVETLKKPGPYTVFAPTDEAFAKLPAGTLENLLKPENKAQLQRILTYHVVSGKVMAADVVKLRSAKAVSGDTISVVTRDGKVQVDNAHVIKTDVAASNGVIHVIDAVILPKNN